MFENVTATVQCASVNQLKPWALQKSSVHTADYSLLLRYSYITCRYVYSANGHFKCDLKYQILSQEGLESGYRKFVAPLMSWNIIEDISGPFLQINLMLLLILWPILIPKVRNPRNRLLGHLIPHPPFRWYCMRIMGISIITQARQYLTPREITY